LNPGRTILAVLVGYLALIVLELIGSVMLFSLLHGQTGGSAVIGGEAVVIVSGIIAGALTARLAPSRPLSHSTALALAIVSATAIATAIARPTHHQVFPNWYPYALALLGGVGAFAGGALVSSRTQQE
jgi:hypothetical protein